MWRQSLEDTTGSALLQVAGLQEQLPGRNRGAVRRVGPRFCDALDRDATSPLATADVAKVLSVKTRIVSEFTRLPEPNYDVNAGDLLALARAEA